MAIYHCTNDEMGRRKVSGNKSNAVVGIMLGAILAFAGYIGIQQWKAWTPGTHWIDITRLIIADADVGADPRIIYERELKADAPGTWSVNIYRHRDKSDTVGVVYCSGAGQASYKAGRPLPPDAITLSWLMGKPCNFERGTYRAVVTIVLNPVGYPAKIIERESNYFVVPPQEDTF
jgi:hypothetical protein